MKTRILAIVMLIPAVAAGCAEDKSEMEPVAAGESWPVVFESAVNNAIIAQETLYPYHFAPNGAELNELGDRDLAVLIAHYESHAGRLRVRQGDASAELYDRRVDFVAQRLSAAGLQMGIGDGLPGGSGMGNEQVLVVMERRNKPLLNTGYQQGSAFGSGTGTSTGGR